MVKNTTGGSKTKGQARKVVSAPKTFALRLAQNEFELYAVVTKILGNGMCHVYCHDGLTRLCHIRGKFRGKNGKRDNFVRTGSWILTGLREWEISKMTDSKKLQNCDLLEVYYDTDRDRLKSIVSDVNWSLLIENDVTQTKTSKHLADDFEFTDDTTLEYEEIIRGQLAASSTASSVIRIDDEVINVDDI